MNKYIIVAFIILSLNIFATHNRAGEILYKRIPPFTNVVGTVTTQVYTYSITLIRYTDSGQGIADRCEDTVRFGDGSSGVALRINGPTTGCGCNSNVPCGEILIYEGGGSYVVKKNIYSITHTYNGPGNYIVSVFDPNRNQGIINIPNSVNQSFYLESIIVANPALGINSSPQLTQAPIDKGLIGSCYTHHPGAFDAEGDSLSYHIIPSLSNANTTVPGYSSPDPGPGGSFYINPSTGLITWCSPQQIGEYNFAFIIKEWRKTTCSGTYQFAGYVMRDMQALIQVGPTYNHFLTWQNASDSCIVAETPFSLNMIGNSSHPATISLLGISSNLFLTATITSSSAISNFTTTFSWNAGCSFMNKELHQIVLKAENVANTRVYRYTQRGLKITPPAPLIHSVTVDTGIVKLKWKKVNACPGYITGYNIYRKPSVNSWSRSGCESGVPAYTGFYLVGSKSVNDTTFDDTNFWAINNGMVGNYIVTSVSDKCSESFADTIKTITYVVGVKKNNPDMNKVNIYPNPASNEIRIDTYEQVKLSVTDCLGKLIYSSDLVPGEKLDVSKFVNGVYFLILQNRIRSTVQKLVIQH